MIFPHIITILITVTLGIIVYLRNKESYQNKFYLIFTTFVSLWIASLMSISLTTNPAFITTFARAANLFIAFALWGLYMLCSTLFEKELPDKSIREKSFALATFISIIGILPTTIKIGFSSAGEYFYQYGLTYPLFTIIFIAYLITSFKNLADKIKTFPEHKHLIKLIFLGLFLSLTFGTVTNLILPMIGNDQYFVYAPFFTLFMNFAFAYAILKLKLWDIYTIVRQSTVYSTMLAIIFGIYYLISYFVLLFVQKQTGSTTITSMITVAILLFLIQPLKDIVTLRLDKTFFRKKYELGKIVSTINVKLSKVIELHKLVEELEKIIINVFNPNKLAIFLKNQTNNKFYPVYKKNIPSTDKLTKLMNSDLKLDAPVVNVERNNLSKKTKELFQDENIEIIASLIVEQQNEGYILLGQKEKEEYHSDDHTLINTIVNYSQHALENIINIQKLKTQQELLFQSEKLAAIGQTVSGLVHELKNPLTGLKLGLTNIKNILKNSNIVDSDIDDILKQSNENIETLQKDLKNFLDFSKKDKLDIQPTDLNMVIQKAQFFVMEQLENKNIEFDYHEKEGIEVNCDSKKIQQILLNLFLNAINAMAKGGKLEISLEQASALANKKTNVPEQAIITVKDNGKGIPKEDLKNIFDPFFTTNKDGTGMGLAVSQEIAKIHGGKITVENNAAKGSTFKLTLPI